MKVYLVISATGSYEDYYEKIERAFFDKAKADEFMFAYNDNLNKCKKMEIAKASRGLDYDYRIAYDSIEAWIDEIEVE